MDIKAIEQRLKAATPGPWVDMHFRSETKAEVVADSQNKIVCHCMSHSKRFKDAIFIANAPTDITNLIAEVKRLQEQVDEMRNCDNCKNISTCFPSAWVNKKKENCDPYLSNWEWDGGR